MQKKLNNQKHDTNSLNKTKKIKKFKSYTHLQRFLTNVVKLLTFSLTNDAKFNI